jgi:hypothetical protein
MAWVEAHAAAGGHGHDALIVAGDVADDVGIFRKTMALLAGAYREVFWVVGNHELWLRRPEREKGGKLYDSLAKLAALRALCAELGVRTAPARLAPAPGDPAHAGDNAGAAASPPAVWVLPLWSWYHASWDREADVPGSAAIEKVMLDFHACCWTSDPSLKPSGDDSLARRFDAMNDAGGDASFSTVLETIEAERAAAAVNNTPPPFVASFSHFLPWQALLPEKRWLYFPNLAKAAGSDALGARVAALRPDAHAFGHTHFSQVSPASPLAEPLTTEIFLSTEQPTNQPTN